MSFICDFADPCHNELPVPQWKRLSFLVWMRCNFTPKCGSHDFSNPFVTRVPCFVVDVLCSVLRSVSNSERRSLRILFETLSWRIVNKTSVFLLTCPRNSRFRERTSGSSRQRFWKRRHLFKKVLLYIKFLHCTRFPLQLPLGKHLLTAGPNMVYPGLQRYLT